MRDIPAGILTALMGKELRPFLLFEMTISEVAYRYTDCDVPIAFNENLYMPRGLRHEPINYSSQRIVDKTSVEIDNLNDELTPAFGSGAARGSEAILRAVVLDDDYHVISDAAVIFFEGEIDDWNRDEKRIQMSLVSLFIRWTQKTLTRHGASCRVKKFKGTQCGYAGASTWCDRTYARCEDLHNEDNFRGFRWLPSITDKDIWWGRSFG